MEKLFKNANDFLFKTKLFCEKKFKKTYSSNIIENKKEGNANTNLRI